MIDANTLRDNASEIASGRLLKARGLLAEVSSDERHAIEEVAYAVALGVADCLVEEAARSTLVAAALNE